MSRSQSIPLKDFDVEKQTKKGTSNRTVEFAPEVEGPYSPPGSDDDDEEGFYYPSKRGYAHVYGGDLSNSSTGLGSSTGDFDFEEEAGSKASKGKGKGKRRKKSSLRSSQGQHSNRRQMRKEPRLVKMGLIILMPILLLMGMFFLVSMASSNESKNASPVVAPTGSSYPSGFNIKNNWGTLSPYFDSGTPFSGIDPASLGTAINGVPAQCRLAQVHVLHRHAERYPTPGIGANMKEFAVKLKNMDEPPAKVFATWLGKWEYRLDTDLLVSSGVGTEFDSGAHFWKSHGQHLFNATEQGFLFYDPVLNALDNGTSSDKPLVIRATTQSRIQTSARAWAAGFFGIYGDDPARTSVPDISKLYNLVLQEEADGMNSTLASYYSCPNANNKTYVVGSELVSQWVNVYLAETQIRLQKLLPGFKNVTTFDAFYMQNLCAFETAAFGNSPFCALFTETEWRGFEYTFDLNFYGSSSHGSAVGPAEGSGWVSELVARLERRLITEPGYGVNVSLTNDESVFPVAQKLYVDLTHDSVIASVLSAMGFDFMKEKLKPTKIPVPRQFIMSRLAPFGARMYVEVLNCPEVVDIAPKATDSDASPVDPRPLDDVNAEDESIELYVRIKLNNRVVPLGSLKHCPEDKTGLCEYDKFIESLQYSLKQIDFDEACYGEPTGWAE